MHLALMTDQTFAAFIKDNQIRFFRIAYSYMKNEDDALDVVQETILKAYEKQHTLRSEEMLQTWFYRILINTSIDMLRRRKKLVLVDELPPEACSSGQVSRLLDSLDLDQALERMPTELKTIIILRFFEDLKLSEIARILRLPVSTVKSRLYRALSVLRADMEIEERGVLQ